MAGSSFTGPLKIKKSDGSKVTFVDADGQITGEIADTLAQGSIYIGNASNITSELDISTDTQILVGNGTTATSVAMSGDATLANTGALTISEGAVEDSMIEGLADGEFIIGVDGTAANNAKVTMSGDATLANDGTLTLAVPNIRAATLHTWDEAASASDVVTVTGALATDVIVATINVRGANNPTTVLSAARTGADSVTVTLDQNGENGVTVVSVMAIQVA